MRGAVAGFRPSVTPSILCTAQHDRYPSFRIALPAPAGASLGFHCALTVSGFLQSVESLADYATCRNVRVFHQSFSVAVMGVFELAATRKH
jgi:hypothetical protein